MKKAIEISLAKLNKWMWATHKEIKASKELFGVSNIYGEQTTRGYLEVK